MLNTIRIWIQQRYFKIVNSIAFYPVLIALLFTGLSALLLELDFSAFGKELKTNIKWLSLRDASTARSIITAITAGVISLAVFSFSMVMIVLNQAASQMSNRVLDKLIGNRFQQMVLGIYIGTIVYGLFILSTIREIDSGIYIPALSIYLLIVLTVFDIFLFIYFLHFITQSVKYEVVIQRIFKDTQASLERSCRLQQEPPEAATMETVFEINAFTAGVYEGFDKQTLLRLCDAHDCTLFFIHTPGTFVLQGVPLVTVNKSLPEEVIKEIQQVVYIHTGESIPGNFFYGFRQLMEVAVKALSKGINDPGTAVESLRALFRLFSYRLCFYPDTTVKNQNGDTRIITTELSFKTIFASTVLPIWDYGKEDKMVQHELHHLLVQLKSVASHESVNRLLLEVKQKMANR